MSVETDKLPPVPQLVSPLVSLRAGDWELRDLRFETNWLQWFIQLRAKVDVINSALVSFGALSNTAGFVSQDANGVFNSRTITGTLNRVTVTNGTGAGGNPVIDIDAQVAFKNAAGVWTGAQDYTGPVQFTFPPLFIAPPSYTVANVTDAVDDAAAATAGVPVGGTYRTGSVLKLRVS